MPTLEEIIKGQGKVETKAEETTETVDTSGIKDLPKEEVLDTTTKTEETVEAEKKQRGRPKKEETKAEETTETKTVEETEGSSLAETLSEKKEDKNEGSFWDDVDKLRGEKLEVDYEGVDPETPEGAFKREQAIQRVAYDSYEEQLSKSYPREYQALVMRMNGEDPSVLYRNEDDLTSIELKEDDEVTQKQILRKDFKAKGLSDKQADLMVKSSFEEGTLFEDAKEAQARAIEVDKKKNEEYQKQIELQRKEDEKVITSFGANINQAITKGVIGDFVIPEKDKQGFYNYLAENVKYENGKFYVITPLQSDDELPKQLQAEFFKYKKGNLNDIIVKKAITMETKRLKSKLSSEKTDQGVTKMVEVKPTTIKNMMGFKD
jgi:hypothetical protein